MVRARVALLLMIAGLVPLAGRSSQAQTSIVREPVSFSVTNLGHTYTIRGELVRPRAGCSKSVLLAMHGLSYGAWAWDFPINPDTYSVAQALAKRGYALLTVDELGYGASAGAGSADHPNGYTINVFGYA